MVGFFQENWSGTSLTLPEQDNKTFNVARKPVHYADQCGGQCSYQSTCKCGGYQERPTSLPAARPRAKTLGSVQPEPFGTPVRRVPVSHSRTTSEDTLVPKDFNLPEIETSGDLKIDAFQFHCFTPVSERESFI